MYQFAILIIVVGGVLGMIYMIVAMMSYPNTKKDMIAYVVLIPILVATFISYFVLKEFCFIITDQQWRVYNQFFK